MQYQFIRFSLQDGIAEIQLNKASKMNAMDSVLLRELNHAVSVIEYNDTINCLFITGAESAFSAGGDLHYMGQMEEEEAREAARWIHWIFNRIEDLPFLTVSLVDGIAFGGGLELAISCDVCIASEKAQFALPEMRYGIIPAGGGTIRFMEKTNRSELLYALTSNKIYTASEARQAGYVQDIVKGGELESFKNKYREKIQSYTSETLRSIKAHIKDNDHMTSGESRTRAFEQEARLFGTLLEAEGRDKIQAFFARKNKEN